MKEECSQCREKEKRDKGRVCQSTDWFFPSEIRFCRLQMLWLIEYLKLMGGGTWPPNPRGSGYVDIPINIRHGKSGAYFVTPAGIAGEVGARLKSTGVEGVLLVAEVRVGLTLDELSPESRMVLNYISGWRYRRMSYSRWKADRKYLQKR